MTIEINDLIEKWERNYLFAEEKIKDAEKRNRESLRYYQGVSFAAKQCINDLKQLKEKEDERK